MQSAASFSADVPGCFLRGDTDSDTGDDLPVIAEAAKNLMPFRTAVMASRILLRVGSGVCELKTLNSPCSRRGHNAFPAESRPVSRK
jgi:hypothetical protein